MFTHLSGGRANIQLIQEAAVRELVEILDRCEGTKAIIWDESLGGPVGLVARYTFLKEHHVTKMYPLRPEPWTDIDVKNIIFITRPNQTLMDYIANNIHEEERKKKSMWISLASGFYLKISNFSFPQGVLPILPAEKVLPV